MGKAVKDSRRDLLFEALRTDYGLRSTFFFRKLNELGMMEFGAQIDQLAKLSSNYDWGEKQQWEISDSAFQQVTAARIEPVRIFAHPRVCIESPRLIAYYRNVAALSQKGAKRLAIPGLELYESGKRPTMPHEQALAGCRLFNRHVSAIIDSSVSFSRRDIDALLFASAGAQIDGAWRNAIGEESEAVVRRMVLSALLTQRRITSFLLKDDTRVPARKIPETALANELERIKGFNLTSGNSIMFGSEPDISILGRDGRLLGAIEVKGGKDTAGALERFGAAQKSFLEARAQNPMVFTIFIASCITDAVMRRIDEARVKSQMFHETYNLSELLASEEGRDRLVSKILWIVSSD